MNDYKYHYLFTTFDIETFDLEDFKYNFVNMTAFRIVDIDDLAVTEVLRDMAKFQSNREIQPINSSYIQVSHPKFSFAQTTNILPNIIAYILTILC